MPRAASVGASVANGTMTAYLGTDPPHLPVLGGAQQGDDGELHGGR